jgi:tyrosyl-DNA phosphodiesterase-1
MLILLRHDEQAQVVIHTANMIDRDWRNMTQAVWRSPLLPLQPPKGLDQEEPQASKAAIGSGERFKTDLLRYLAAYSKRLTDLTTQLNQYDFSSVQAAFIGSAPSRQKLRFTSPSSKTSWGWLGLREILSTIPVQTEDSKAQELPPNVVIQISSIATLGGTPAWLTHFQSVLSSHFTDNPFVVQKSAANFFSKPQSGSTSPPPRYNIVFPTAHEIRTSLDGYDSGASIHTKIQSPSQLKQLDYLRPILCHWKHHSSDVDTSRKAGRGPAAPHIKTYIRFHDEDMRSIDWAMVTSANLSKQAWGELENKSGETWIQSYECGVVVWPDLLSCAQMIPVFGKDVPGTEELGGLEGNEEAKSIVGLRMPYDLPLERYEDGEVPWCATAAHLEPDWKGQFWKGY